MKQQNTKLNFAKVTVFFIITVLLLIYICMVIFNLIINPTDTFIMENGKLYLDEVTDGYILREEIVVQGENYKNGIVQIKSEGEKVAKDDAIFRYKGNGEDKLQEKIEELNIKLQEALKNQKDILPSDVTLLETQIKEKVEEIYGINNYPNIKVLKKEINDLILKKAKIVGELSPSGSYIKKLIEERSSYETQLNSSSEYINAPISGIVSYKIDGYENFFNSKNIEYLSRELLESIDVKMGQIIESSTEKAKIVNNYACYIAVIMNSEEAKAAKVGDKVSLEFLNLEAITASIENIFEEDTGTRVIVFKVNHNVEKLLDSRKISVNVIWWSKSGLKVPNSAIITEDNKNYIIRNKAGYKEKVLIKVLKQNENYAIIDNYGTEELKKLGYTSSEIRKMKKIQLYDEIYVD